MIEFQGVSKWYGKKRVLDDISFTVEEGEFVVLIGPSGCGKTTTLKMINRLIEADGGRILVRGEDIAKGNPVRLRRSIGYVIQQIGLFPNMTVEQNIAVVPRLLKYDKARCGQIVRELLALVDMPYEEYGKKYPGQMSGGQQQRIGVLRALASSPPIVLMDEPFGALDPMTRETLQDEVKRIQKKLNKTIIFVTHDMAEALRLADTVIFMNEGKILQKASPEEMLQNPGDDLIRSFMGRHIPLREGGSFVAADFMRANVLKVDRNKRVLECIDLMSRRSVNALVVVGEDNVFLGTVSVDRIKSQGRAGQKIGELVENDVPVVEAQEDAKEAFERLNASGTGYIVVLHDNRTVAGLITKTSMAKAMAEALWGEIA